MTAASDIDFSPVLAHLAGEHTACVCGHVNPDGDSIGCVLAMTHVLEALGMEATPLLASRDCPRIYDFLPGYDRLVPAADYHATPDVFISVDVPSVERTGDAAAVYARAKKSIAFDHHAGTGEFADVSVIDTSAAAAALLVWEFAAAAGVGRDADLATSCYTALVTDTGRFQYQNADERSFAAAAEMTAAGASPSEVAFAVYERESMASLKLRARALNRMELICGGRAVLSYVTEDDFGELDATPEDGEEIIDFVRELGGVDVVVMLRNQGPVIRGSLRAKADIDISGVARELGGGGHAAAAGFTVKDTFDAARAQVEKLLSELFDSLGSEGALEGAAGGAWQ